MFSGYTEQFLVCLFVFCTVGFSQVCLWPFVCESQDSLGMIWVKKEMSFFFSAKQFCVFHKYSRGKKSICESNSLRGLHQMKMLFFLNPPHLTQEVFFSVTIRSLALCLSLSRFLPLIWTLTSESAPGCLSQTAVQRCDNAFFLPVPFMTFFFLPPSVPFFCFFPFKVWRTWR